MHIFGYSVFPDITFFAVWSREKRNNELDKFKHVVLRNPKPCRVTFNQEGTYYLPNDGKKLMNLYKLIVLFLRELRRVQSGDSHAVSVYAYLCALYVLFLK